MKENIIARRYAEALAQHAVENNELDSVREDLDALADLLDPERGDISVPELLAFLHSPTIPQVEKVKLTDVLCEKINIGKSVSDFLNVLIKKNRIALTPFIAREFDRIAGGLTNVVTASVETARKLSGDQLAELQKLIAEASGAEVRLTQKINPKLIAGFRVQMGDILLDGSVENRLQRLGARLT
jgi:F-type H+-transporting ATPase subunit delta